MVLKGLGRMSWLYYDTCKLLDVLIFSKQDDKRLKKSELFSAVFLKYSSKGVWVALEDINMLFSLSLLKIQSFRWYSERWLHMSRSRHNLSYSSTNEINLKLKWQLEWNEHFKRSFQLFFWACWHIQRLLISIQLLPYIYFILSFFKFQTKLPWIKTGFSHLTIDIPILPVWRKFVIIDSVHRPATSLLQLNGRASEVLIGRSQVRLLILANRVLFSWVYLCHSLKDIIFRSLFSWKCCLFGWKVWESFRNNLYGTTLHVPSFWYLAMIENKYTVIAYFCLYFDSVVPLSISTYLKLRPN